MRLRFVIEDYGGAIWGGGVGVGVDAEGCLVDEDAREGGEEWGEGREGDGCHQKKKDD